MDGPPILPAATAVLVREHTGEVLMLLRHASHGFMASVWVFPGGRVDHEDLAAGEAFVRAAQRETYEEAGVLLTDPPAVAPAGHPRDFAAAIPEAAHWLELSPFARWVTPPNERRRYDTLFFCGLVPDIEAAADLSEVVAARWIHPADAIAAHRQGRLPLAPPTVLTLHALLAAAYTPADGYHPSAALTRTWSAAHSARLMSWVREVASDPVALCPTLVKGEGGIEVLTGPSQPWPVPAPLHGLASIRQVRGAHGAHWELLLSDR